MEDLEYLLKTINGAMSYSEELFKERRNPYYAGRADVLKEVYYLIVDLIDDKLKDMEDDYKTNHNASAYNKQFKSKKLGGIYGNHQGGSVYDVNEPVSIAITTKEDRNLILIERK